MKKTILITLALCLAALPAMVKAQSADAQKTTIRAIVTIEKQTIKTGPYARFAQKYLGVIAPLSDKQNCTVTEAHLTDSQTAAAQAPAAAQTGVMPLSHTRSTADFVRVSVDRHDAIERSPEEAARDAANTIFSLRKHRIELVTGAAGENVFGAGLPAALAEIDRLEEEYLALFMGKQSVQVITRAYDIIPEAGETSRVVCRYSPADGLVSADDLSGSPIVLQMTILDKVQPEPVGKPVKKDKNATVEYRLEPANVAFRLVDGNRELTSMRTQVSQMGRLVEVIK